MFGKPSEASVSRSQSLVQEGMTIRGDANVEGDLRLDGVLEGSLLSKSKVTVGATGVVRADIDAAEVLVMGKVTGKINALKRIELRRGAQVEGDLSTPALVIEEGVYFQGACRMGTSQSLASVTGTQGRSGAAWRSEMDTRDVDDLVSPPTGTN